MLIMHAFKNQGVSKKMIFDIGRVAIKLAGRDANNYAVVIDVIDDNFVLIDGNVRRKKCNIKHLEPLDIILKIDKKESTENIKRALKEANLKVKEKRPKKVKVEKEKKNVKPTKKTK